MPPDRFRRFLPRSGDFGRRSDALSHLRRVLQHRQRVGDSPHRTAGSFIADRFDFADGWTFCIHQRHREHLHSSAPFRKRSSAKNVIQPLLLTSTVLIVFHFVFSLLLKNSSVSMFDPNETLDTLIPASIRQSEWIFPKFENLLFMDALAMIAISGFTAAAVIAILLKRKPPRERVLRILAPAGFTAAVLSPYIWYLFWIPFEYFYHADGVLRLLSIPLSFFAARMHCLPGIFPFIIFGLWFGVLLHYKPTYAEVRQKTRPLALASLILLIVFVGVKLLFTLGRETAVGAFFEKAGLITAVAENSPDVLTGKIGNAFLDYKTLPTEFQFFGAVLIF